MKKIITLILVLIVSSIAVSAFAFIPEPKKPTPCDSISCSAPDKISNVGSGVQARSSQYGLFKRYLRSDSRELWNSCMIKKSDGYISNSLKSKCLKLLWDKYGDDWRENGRLSF